MPTLRDIPLREQKRARTRLALLDALLQRLDTRPVDDIPVAELAEAAGVSQATFFNYFATKADLLTFHIQVWSVEVGAVARRAERAHDSAIEAIEALFAHSGAVIGAHPDVMLEAIAHQARMPANLTLQPVGLAERLLRLPDEDDVMELPDGGLGDILPDLLERAIARGELPAGSDVRQLTLALASVFFGVPLVLGRAYPGLIPTFYRRQLALLWAGARALEAP